MFERLLQNSFVKNSFWSVLGNGLGYGFLLLSGILIARFLGKDLYGEYGMVKTTMFNIAAFATFGLGYTSTRYVANFICNQKENVYSLVCSSLKVTLFTSSILAVLLIYFSNSLAHLLDEPSLSKAFQYLGIVIVAKALCTTQNGILAGFKSFKYIAINTIISGIVMFVLSISFTYFWGIEGALLSLGLSQISNVFLNFYSLKKCSKDIPHILTKSYSKEIIVFSLPVVLQEFSFLLNTWGGSFLLVKFSSLGELGLYSAASQWSVIVVFIPGMLSNVVLSYLSDSTQQTKNRRHFLNMMIKINLACTLVPFVLVYIFADWISTFYGETFVTLPLVLRLYMFTTFLTTCSNVFQSEFIARGKTYLLFWIRLFRDFLSLALLYFLLIYFDGVDGAKCNAITGICTGLFYLIALIMAYKQDYLKN